MLFWNLFIQAACIVYAVMFIGLGLSWLSRRNKREQVAANEGEV
nr:hypothetical protein [uncultured Cohaesibacter sp.]